MNFFLLHGWLLWSAWSIFGLIQVSSNRYFKGACWKRTMMMHRISGMVILVLTLYYAAKAWSTLGWKVIPNLHSVFVFPVLGLIVLIAFGGIFTRSRLRRSVWQTKGALMIKNIHKGFAYFVLIWSYFAIATGIHFYRMNPAHPSDFPLEYLHMTVMALIVFSLEFRYQQSLKSQEPFTKDVLTITLEDFNARIRNGEKLVLLDDLILDIEAFIGEHPGG